MSKVGRRDDSFDPKLSKEAKARHIIVFLTDARHVQLTKRDIVWQLSRKGGLTSQNPELEYKIFEAHGATNFRDEKEIFEELKWNQVKLILATKVLETSVTIENVGFIIDFGKEKFQRYNIATGIKSKITQTVSSFRFIF